MVKHSKHILRKSVFRSIGKSIGRYLAIVGIIALGSGFFTGLRVTNTSMIETGDRYLKDTAFFDFRLLNTYGWTEESVTALLKTEGVAEAEGSVSTDVLAEIGGRETVLRAMSLGSRINVPQLVSGRLPERADECAVDCYSIGGLSLGDTIRIASSNDDDRREMFACDEYTVTGMVRTPLYINYERGTTTLGNGSVDAFVILTNAGFDTDYYTEIYLRAENPGYLYSDEYTDRIDGLTDPVTEAAEAEAMRRFTDLRDDAQEELDDASKEYRDALQEYEDGLQEYEDGLQEYEDGLQEYEDGLREYAEKKEDAYSKINSGLHTVKKGMEELNGKRESVSATVTELNGTVAQLKQGIAMLRAQRAQTEADPTLPEEMKAAVLAGIDAQLNELNTNLTMAENGLAQAQAGLKQIDEGLDQYSAGKRKLYNAKAVADREFADAWQELEDARQELEDAERELADAKTELEDGRRELEDARVKLEDAQKEIDDLEKPDTYLLDRSTNTGYVCFDSDSQIVNGISLVFPVFFFAVAALVCVTTMTRMVTDERGQIGTLKALGYGSGTIMAGYLFYSGSASVIGSVIGTVAGSYVFPKVIWTAYGIMYSMPDNVTVFDTGLILLSCVSYTLLSLAVTYFSCRNELNEPAAELIRPKSPPPGKRILLERIPVLWKRFSFLRKVSLRNVFRYEKRLIMMVLGIGGCTALLLTGFGLNDSITTLADRQYTEISLYDAAVSFTEDQSGRTEDFLKECGETAAKAAFLSSASVDCSTEAHTGSVSLIAAEDFSTLEGLMDFHNGTERVDAPEEGCCIISENLADRYEIGGGDFITLTRDETERLTMRVTGVYENVIYNYVYTTADTVRASYGEVPYKLAYLNFPEDADAHEAGAVIAGIDGVAAVNLTEDMLGRVNSVLSSMKYVVLLVIACAAALDFVVLFNLTNINILERIREIATLKVLGFYPSETSRYIMRENSVLTLCGCAAGIPMGILLCRFVISQIKIDMIAFKPLIYTPSYGYAVALTFLFTGAVNLIMQPKLGRINMAEALKSVE